MATPNVFTDAQLAAIWALPEIAAARAKVDSGAKVVYFTVPLSDELKAQLRQSLGLDLTAVDAVPMRWIQGDTAPHVDAGPADFENTYLVYMNDSAGEFALGDASYPITKNTGFVFQEGLRHETLNTGSEPRLLLGPMSEQGIPVGSPILYCSTLANALAYNADLGSSSTYTVGNLAFGNLMGITSWRIASTSSGSSSQLVVYQNGDVLNGDGIYFLYPAVPCFREGTKILTLVGDQEVYRPVETLRKGDLVKTARDGFKPIVLIGKGEMTNSGSDERSENRLYRCTKDKYPEMTEDLYITGCHSILVAELTEDQREKTKAALGKIFVTDGLYRLMACIDERAEPWTSLGSYTIWHFALEHDDIYMNYGIYANGLLVESCNIRFLRDKSNMTLLE